MACQQQSTTYQPEGLRKLSPEEMLERAKKGDFGNVEDIILKNKKGEIISRDALEKMGDLSDYWTDPYVNKEGKVVEAIFRKATEADNELRNKIMEIANPIPALETVAINCAEKGEILDQVYESDQKGGRKSIDNQEDLKNLSIIVSLLEKCGMPTLKEVSQQQLMAIWLVIQHSDLHYMKMYAPMLEASAKRGDLDLSMMALTKDRILMYEGKPQIYGSQVSNGKLWDLMEPESVNKRRKEVGLDPLEDYLKIFDISFNVPQKD